MTALQGKIIRALIENGGHTSYGLSKLIKKSIPSIEYALVELVENGVVLSNSDTGKMIYSPHDFFKNKKAAKEVGTLIVEILKIIEKSGDPPSSKGYVSILETVIGSIDIKNSS